MSSLFLTLIFLILYIMNNLNKPNSCESSSVEKTREELVRLIANVEVEVDTEKVLRLFKEATEMGTTDADAYLALGTMADIECNTEGVRRLWEKAAEMGSAEAYRRLGSLLLEEDEYDRLCELSEKVEEIPTVNRVIALGPAEEKITKESKRLYKKAIEMGSADAYFDLGLLEKEGGNIEEANRLLAKAAEMGSATVYFYLGSLEKEKGNIEEANRLLAKAAEMRSAKTLNLPEASDR